jgi:hypothetical protein
MSGLQKSGSHLVFRSLACGKDFNRNFFGTGGNLTEIFPRQAETLFHLGRIPFRNFIDTWETFLVSLKTIFEISFLVFPTAKERKIVGAVVSRMVAELIFTEKCRDHWSVPNEKISIDLYLHMNSISN